MTAPRPHSWSTIEDLPAASGPRTDPSIAALAQAWVDQADELRARRSFEEFNQRLRREWAIESGAIERLYDLTQGATRTLIEKGLDAALLNHGDTDIDPRLAVARMQDQHAAIEGVHAFVSNRQQLTKGYIRQLHQVVTAHQEWVEGRDQFGTPVKEKLRRGQWKDRPNNVEGQDGFLFEFCPPVQVESEMDRLLELHGQHEQAGVSPLVEAAWLHHRFTLIHPFQDGNGRMARALATLVLLRARWMPLVVTREDKPAYLQALRQADEGDLQPLVDHFGKLQRGVIIKALSVADDAIQVGAGVEGILEKARRNIERQQSVRDRERAAMTTAGLLCDAARQRLEAVAEVCQPIVDALSPESKIPPFRALVHFGHLPGKGPQFAFQVRTSARQLGYVADIGLFHAWAGLVIETDTRTEILISIHGVGQDTGVFGASATYFTKSTGNETGTTAIGELQPLDGLFTFASLEDPDNVRKRFLAWLEHALALGLDKWQREVL